jgi:hypothetical protein
MNWTRVRPTTAGWYWWRIDDTYPGVIIEVGTANDALAVWFPRYMAHSDRMPIGEFAGPIQRPTL